MWDCIALSGKVVIILTNQPDKRSSSGESSRSDDAFELRQKVMRFTDLVFADFVNASVHTKLLQKALEELWQ